MNNLGPALPGWLTIANPNITFSIANNGNNNSTVHINSNNNDRWIRGHQNTALTNPLRLEWVNSGNGWMQWSSVGTANRSGYNTGGNGLRIDQVAGTTLTANIGDNNSNAGVGFGIFEAFVPAGASIRGGERTNTSVQVWEA